MGDNSAGQKSGSFEVGPFTRVLISPDSGLGLGLGIEGKVPLPGPVDLQMDVSYVVKDGKPPVYHEEISPHSRDVCQKSTLIEECDQELAKYARTVQQSNFYQFGVSPLPEFTTIHWGPGMFQFPIGVLAEWERTKTIQFGAGGIKKDETTEDTLKIGPRLGGSYRVENPELPFPLALSLGQSVLFSDPPLDILIQFDVEMAILF